MHNKSEFVPKAPRWSDIAPLSITGSSYIDTDKKRACFNTSFGLLQIQFYDFGFRLRIGNTAQNDYGIVNAELFPLDITLQKEGEDLIILTSGQLSLKIKTHPFSFSFYKNDKLIKKSSSDGHFVREHRLPPLAAYHGGWLLSFDLKQGDHLYGTGEKWDRLNKRGQLIRSHNHDALGVNAEQSYKNTPFVWCQPLYSSCWGVFVNTPFSVTHALGYSPWSHRSYGLWIENGNVDLFFMCGENGQEIIRHYHHLTGYPKAPPDWAMGVILSRTYYKTADDILNVARTVRERNMPCDIITFDGRAWQDTATRFAFEWDKARYPDPHKILTELKEMNFKICVWEYPLISIMNPLFKEMADKGWLLRNKKDNTPYLYEWDPEPFSGILTALPTSGIVDFTHPDAYAYWRDRHKELFDIGVDMIKADFGEQVPENDNIVAYNGANGIELHNVYALLYNKCVFDAAELYSKNGAFLFSRAGWAGSHRYPALWGGDPQADWEGLIASIRGGLSWGLSGGPYYATDVGGFYKDTRDDILYARWMQASVFSAHMRLHGIGEREPWSYGTEAEKAANAALKLRYDLMPYIIKTVKDSEKNALPVMRAMPIAYPDQPILWDYDMQYMFGNDIFVAPITRADGQVQFLLPEGNWTHLITGEKYTGNRLYRETLGLHEIAAFKKVE